jgi:NitT/TauT family transport system substrate-binding protein
MIRLAHFGAAAALALAVPAAEAAEPMPSEITIGIGTQDTTTNTVTTGIVIRQLHLLEKYLPHDGAYAGVKYTLDWQNFTSGPPVTNGMMAGKLQFGGMGDYPLLVNGYTFASNPDSHSELIAVAAYNMAGAGNGIMVNVASPYQSLADLKGKVVSVPFGSAAHGMVLAALQQQNLPENFLHLVNQSPEIGATNLQEQKIDGHADFVPFAELLPFRGFARKIFDGAQTGQPTWHGLVVRTDFAAKYPEIVTAYLRAVLDANAWVRADPVAAAKQISAWTGTDKEVVYIFLGPGGLMTLDPTIKPALLKAAEGDAAVLRKLDRMKDFDVAGWANDRFIRAAFKEAGLDYDKQLASQENYQIHGHDDVCNTDITDPAHAGEIWVDATGVHPYSSAACTLKAVAKLRAAGAKIDASYVFDTPRGLKLFADKAYYVAAGGKIMPFLLKADAEADAAKTGGKLVGFEDAIHMAAAE